MLINVLPPILYKKDLCVLSSLDKATTISVTNGGLTATCNSTANGSIRATHHASTGKKFFSATVTAWSGTSFTTGVGLANANAVMQGTQLGGNNDGGFESDTSHWIIGGAAPFGLVTWAVNDIQDWAVDLGARKLWTRTNGGTWSQSGDPSAGTNGGDISAMTGDIYPAATLVTNNDSITFNFTGPFTYAIPSGYGLW